MLSFASSMRVFVCERPTDMRKSFDGLAGCVEQIVGGDPLSGHLFVFFNRRRTMVKMLLWDRSGFCLISKRLESGRFALGAEFTCREIDMAQLVLILEGIELRDCTRRKRFHLPAA
jgi:transposase